MYMCAECGATFPEAEFRKEDYGLSSDERYGMYDTIGVCPYCGSEDYDDAKECISCGEYHLNDDLCDDCKVTLDKLMKYVSDEMNVGGFEFEDMISNYFGW